MCFYISSMIYKILIYNFRKKGSTSQLRNIIMCSETLSEILILKCLNINKVAGLTATVHNNVM